MQEGVKCLGEYIASGRVEKGVEGRSVSGLQVNHLLDEILLPKNSEADTRWVKRTITHSHRYVFYCRQLCIDIELSFSILVELAKGEKRGSFKEEFRDDTTCAEAVHRLCDLSISLAQYLFLRQLEFLCTDFRIGVMGVEAFGSDVACSAAGGVKVEGEIGGVVEGQVCGLVGCKVGDIHPIPGRNEYVLGLDIAMRDVTISRVTESIQQLKSDPLLLNGTQERARATGESGHTSLWKLLTLKYLILSYKLLAIHCRMMYPAFSVSAKPW